MLLGMITVAAPVIIHLLNRRHARTVPWGAMRFLRASMAARNRRILLEEFILLLARCAIPVLLFLAAARPVATLASPISWPFLFGSGAAALILLAAAAVLWHTRRRQAWAALGLSAAAAGIAIGAFLYGRFADARHRPGGAGRTDTVIILDASRSMALKPEEFSESNFERAVREARNLIATMRPGDTVGILLAGPTAVPLIQGLTYDRKAADRTLQRVRTALAGVADIPAALDAALNVLRRTANPNQRIVVFTDGQRIGWRIDDVETWNYLRRRTAMRQVRPAVLVRRFPTPPLFRNLAIEDVTFSREVIGTDSPVTIQVSVRNTGLTPLKPDAVEVSVDGRPVARRAVRNLIPAGNSLVVPCSYRFRKAGIRVVRVRLIADDDLPADDAAVRVIDVLDALPVLLVEGAPSPVPLENASDYVRIALNPTGKEMQTDAQRTLEALAAPRTVTAANLPQAGAPDQWLVIVLADVRALPPAAARAIAGAVRRGAGLLITAGPRSDPDFYNHWTTPEGESICPLRLTAWQEMPSPVAPAPGTLQHPALDALRRALERTPRSVFVRATWRTETPTFGAEVQIGGKLENGLPFLAEKNVGAGRVCMITFPLHPSVTTFPLHPAFVPVTDRLVAHLGASNVALLNLRPGQEFVYRLSAGGGEGARHGLLGEYFAGNSFERRAAVRVDSMIDFNWHTAAPHPDVPADHFSARWTGWVSSPVTGAVDFHVTTDDGARLWVGGKQIINEWYAQYATKHSASVRLRRNQWTPIRLEYYENAGDAVIRLAWSARGLSEQVIPSERLRPAPAPGLFVPSPGQPETRLGPNAATVERPDSVRASAKASMEGAALVVRYSDTVLPGTYRLRLAPDLARIYLPSGAPPGASQPRSQVGHAPDDAHESSLPFVVLDTAEESVLTPLSDTEIERLGADLGIHWFDTSDAVQAFLAGRPVGVDLTRQMLTALLVIIVLESVLARWCTVQRRMHRFTDSAGGVSAKSAQTQGRLVARVSGQTG